MRVTECGRRDGERWRSLPLTGWSEEMPFKRSLQKEEEGRVGSLAGGNSRSKGPEVGENLVYTRNVTLSPQLEHL